MQAQATKQLDEAAPDTVGTRRREEGGPYLAPIANPPGLFLKVLFFFVRRKVGKVLAPLTVFVTRMPSAFASFYGKLSQLDKKLQLPPETAVAVRQQVASLNTCHFCMDATRWYEMTHSGSSARSDALAEYRTSPLFTDAERAALDYATELTNDKKVAPGTFARLKRYYCEREICDLVWLVASEHLYNMTNNGLNIGSDGLCELSVQRRRAART